MEQAVQEIHGFATWPEWIFLFKSYLSFIEACTTGLGYVDKDLEQEMKLEEYKKSKEALLLLGKLREAEGLSGSSGA